MTETHSPIVQGACPSRRSVLDWLSVSRLTESDREIAALREAVQSLIREHCGYGETVPMKSAGNFGDGEKFKRFGAELKWTTRTQALINGWDEQGRCVGWINFTARGSSGVGGLSLLNAVSLLTSLRDLGFDVVRRVDATVDLFDSPDLSLFLMKSRLESGLWKIPRRFPSSLTYFGPLIDAAGRPQPATLYLGSDDSPTRLVVYDKGAQLGEEKPWLRFECRCRHEGADWAIRTLLEAADAAYESGCAEVLMDRAVVGIVRGSADIKDVSAFNDVKALPKNWIRSPLAVMPDELVPVFGEIAPLRVAELKLRGGFASRVRHLQRSAGPTLWKLCLMEVAQGRDPGALSLSLAAGSAARLSPEDFEEVARLMNVPPAAVEQAEVDLINLCCRLFDLDEQILFSDKQAIRADMAVRIGGV